MLSLDFNYIIFSLELSIIYDTQGPCKRLSVCTQIIKGHKEEQNVKFWNWGHKTIWPSLPSVVFSSKITPY